MSYQALYRKYRPSTLEDVIGQDIVIKILKNAIINNKVCHAYMFSGPRGIGKTSIAKILAKTVNCLELNNGDACGKCKNCLSISDCSNPDIIEIDAASNNGVDEIREIKSKINLVPSQLKYKVYIIDEVHMLSIGAFNALLKTLEEPPEHVIFILATTDLHKVPVTIISRCQCLEFHRISCEDITKRLEYICEKENIKVENEILSRIAELSDGGMRDAVGMLDKLNAYSNSNITIEDFEKVNGIVSLPDRMKFLDNVMNGNINYIISFIDSIYDNGKDFVVFIQDMINLCKNLCVSYYVNNENKYNIDLLLSFLNSLNNTLKNAEFSSNIRIALEIELLSFINKNILTNQNINDNDYHKVSDPAIFVKNNQELQVNSTVNDNDYQQTNDNTDKIISREIISPQLSDETSEKYDEILDIIINNCFARANKKNKLDFENNWNKLNDYALDNEFGAVACYISDGVVRVVGENEVLISFAYESMVDRGIKIIEKISKLFEKIYNKHYDIALVTNDRWNHEKENYILNMNNNIKYEYKKLPDISIDNNVIDKNNRSITDEAIELFGEDMISIN